MRDETAHSGSNAHFHELLDERQIQDVWKLLRERLNRNLHFGYAHERHGQIAHEWRVLNKLHTQTGCSNESFDDSVDRDGYLEPVIDTEKDLEHKVHIVEAKITRLSRESLIRDGNLVVLNS
jgi:hypothetical protein